MRIVDGIEVPETLGEAKTLTYEQLEKACDVFNKNGMSAEDIQKAWDAQWRNGFEIAIERIKESLKELRLKKRTSMTADYSWAMEDVDKLIDEIEKDS